MRASIICLAVLGGCSSSNEPAANDPGASDTGGEAATASLEIITGVLGGPKVAGVNVAALRLDGTVLARTTTGEDGHGALDGVSYGAEPICLVAWREGYAVEVEVFDAAGAAAWRAAQSVAEGGTPLITMFPTGTTVPKVSGALAGAAPGSTAVVSSSAGWTVYQGAADAYSLRVLPSAKGMLVAVNFAQEVAGRALTQTISRWIEGSHDALTSDKVVDLDFAATSLTPKHRKFQLEITGGADGALGGDSSGFSYAFNTHPGAISGLVTSAVPSADNKSFDVDLEYVETSSGPPTVTVARILRTDGSSSDRILDHLPAEGEIVKDFELPVPVTVSKQKLTDPFALDGAPAGAVVMLAGTKGGGQSVFRVALSENVAKSAFTLPPLPAEAIALVPASMQMRILTVREPLLGGASARYVSGSRPFTVTR